MFRFKLYISCLVIPLLLAWMLPSAQATDDAEASLRKRVTAYWQHKIKRDFKKAYPLESSEIREKASLEEYVKDASTGTAVWKKATIKSVTIEGSSATVHVEINYIIMGIYCPKEGLTRTIRDYWQLEDGTWYHRLKPLKKNDKA